MAAAKDDKTIIMIDYDHLIARQECCNILKAVFKYIIFHRRQIPVPIQTLELELNSLKQRNMRPTNSISSARRSYGPKFRKKLSAVNSINRIANELDMFISTNRVHKLALVFGSTIVSPKEIFYVVPLFSLSADNEEMRKNTDFADMEKKRIERSVRNTMISIVMDENLVCMRGLGATSLFVFLLAPVPPVSTEQDPSPFFVPKQSFKMPANGKNYQIILTNDKVEDCSRRNTDVDQEHNFENNLIWYQAADVVRGFSV